jgi:hypothetical protein
MKNPQPYGIRLAMASIVAARGLDPSGVRIDDQSTRALIELQESKPFRQPFRQSLQCLADVVWLEVDVEDAE